MTVVVDAVGSSRTNRRKEEDIMPNQSKQEDILTKYGVTFGYADEAAPATSNVEVSCSVLHRCRESAWHRCRERVWHRCRECMAQM